MSCLPCRRRFSNQSMVPHESMYLLWAAIISSIITSLVCTSKGIGGGPVLRMNMGYLALPGAFFIESRRSCCTFSLQPTNEYAGRWSLAGDLRRVQ